VFNQVLHDTLEFGADIKEYERIMQAAEIMVASWLYAAIQSVIACFQDVIPATPWYRPGGL
jgi:hypothetical protein